MFLEWIDRGAIPVHPLKKPRDGDIHVACVGDSITAGYALADPAHDAYPSQLARLLGDGYEVRNFGVSAATLMDAGNYPYRERPAHDEALAWQMQADGSYQRPSAPIHAPRNVQQALMLRYHTVAAPAPERHHTQRAARPGHL